MTATARRHRTLAARLERQQIPLGLLVLAITAFLIWISIIAINGIPFSNPMPLRAVLPPTGPIIKTGDDVLIAGQRVGEIRGVKPVVGGRLVTMDISRSDPIGRDASARIRLRGLAGATYIQLTPGNTSSRAPDNFTIPLSRTGTNTELTDVVAQFDAAARADMSKALTDYGAGIAGRGADVNQALADLPQLEGQGQPVLRSLTPQPGALSGLMHELDRTMVGLQGFVPGDFGGLLSAFHQAFDAILSQRTALGQTIDELRPLSDQAQVTLPIADPVLRDTSAAAKALEPAATALQRALPSLNTLLARSAEVSELSRLAHALNPVLAVAGPVLTRLWPGAASLAPLAAALGPFARYTAPYTEDIFLGPYGFTSHGWGGFSYAMGQASGHKAVRFAPVFTCTPGRDPYPAPGQALTDAKRCPF
jgi:virulence factor Mce-like protein